MSEGVIATVAVVVRDDERVYRLLTSLLSQTVSSDDYEVIVVENGSEVHSDVSNLGRSIRYFHLPDPNIPKARNCALHAAKGRYFLTIDADCIATPHWLETMVSELEVGNYACVGGVIEKLNSSNWVQNNAITIVDGQRGLNYLPALDLPYVVGANSGFIKSALQDVGGFDEQFISGSDVDICYRLGLRGMTLGHVASAIVHHEDRPSVREHFQRFRKYAIYQVLLFAKYRQHSGRTFVINEYPAQRLRTALATMPRATLAALRGRLAPIQVCWLQIVEAAGIWFGDVEGSLRYRVIYF
jgi:GT2 family glycosyltransferase